MGLQLKGRTVLSELLLGACAAAFLVLLGLNVWRLVSFPRSGP